MTPALGTLASPLTDNRLATQQATSPTGNLLKLRHATPAQVDAVAQDFEAQFISQMMESMFSTLDVKNALGGGEAEETFQALMINEYGKVIARTGGIGVADQVKRSILKLQEVSPS